MPVVATGLPAPLITRGMGVNPRLLTSGLSPAITKTIAVVRRAVKGGRRVYQDLYDKYKITACLLEVNGKELIRPIINTIERLYNDKAITVQAKPVSLLYKKNDTLMVWISRFRIRRDDK